MCIKNRPPFCFTLALIAIPQPNASGLQTGGHSRANRRVQFSIKGKNKKTKFQLHNSPLKHLTSYFLFELTGNIISSSNQVLRPGLGTKQI